MIAGMKRGIYLVRRKELSEREIFGLVMEISD